MKPFRGNTKIPNAQIKICSHSSCKYYFLRLPCAPDHTTVYWTYDHLSAVQHISPKQTIKKRSHQNPLLHFRPPVHQSCLINPDGTEGYTHADASLDDITSMHMTVMHDRHVQLFLRPS